MDSTKILLKTVDSCPHVNSTNITYNIGGQPVFKDQCERCYENQQSENGLDICLKCFTANCNNGIFDHSNLHFFQKNHSVVLNIKEVLIEQEKNESQETNKITKLAINKPGGIDLNSNERWENWMSINCKACNVNIDYSKNEKLNALVVSIINISSAEKKDDIMEWEEQHFPCEHTLTLEQTGAIKIASKMTATCNDCNLSSNLWLCLTCGNLACGRKNFDGTGGNGHAKEHFNKSGHPLVVKTGTITASGEASLFCYSCDNDVKDPELAVHLKNLGIDVSTQVKTEKTTLELQLEFNLNFTLSKTIEEGKVLIDVYGPGNTGLENIGNSCYMNSIIQVLFSLDEFKIKYFENALEHLSSCSSDAKECFICQMSKIMYGMHSGIYSAKQSRIVKKVVEGSDVKQEEIEEYQKGIKPSSFKKYFNKGHQEYSSTRQQDASEYLSYLLEKIDRQEKLNSKESSRSLFDFDIETRNECSQCHLVKYKNQRTCFLYLNVPNWENKKEETSKCELDEIIASFTAEEKIDLKCVKCGGNEYVRTQRVKSFPKYLIIIFGRFVYDWVSVKLETKLNFPMELDLKLFATDHKKQNELVYLEQEKEEIEIEPEIDKSALNLLMENQVPELAAKHALLSTGNNADLAIMWYFENMDNPIVNQPIPKKKISKNNSSINNKPQINEELVETIISIINCSRDQAVGALSKCDNDIERSIDYIYSHPDESFSNDSSVQEQKISNQVDSIEFNKNNSPIYNMYGFITHLGKNTSFGHYVCHIKKENNWIYYNDSRVSISNDPPLSKGFIFVFKNKN